MPGIATHFTILSLTISELKKPTSGPALNNIAIILEDNIEYAHFGVLGPNIGDFLPATSEGTTNPFPNNYGGIWQTILRFMGGDLGLYQTLTDIDEFIEKLRIIIRDEDLDELQELKNTRKIEKILETLQNLTQLMSGLRDLVIELTESIANGLRPKVSTSSPEIPVPEFSEWEIRNLLHWKKTGAFTTQLIQDAQQRGDNRLLAYAYGYLIGYTAEIAGSSFVNSIVGGPSRTQWWRQRFVENYIDSWVYGYYSSAATIENDIPQPSYAEWSNLCSASLHKQLAIVNLDFPNLMHTIKINGTVPSVLPSEFSDFWTTAFQQTYGGSSLINSINEPQLNKAFVLINLVLWFQTSNVLKFCTSDGSMEPPDENTCGITGEELDPFRIDPATGMPITPQIQEPDIDIDETALICGIIAAILGGTSILGGNLLAGGTALFGGISTIESAFDINWSTMRCDLYWFDKYLYNFRKGINQIIVIGGFGFPSAKSLANDTEVLQTLISLFGLPEEWVTWQTGKALVKSQRTKDLFPSKPWGGELSTFNKPPGRSNNEFENPKTISYYREMYPNFFIDDNFGNPLSNGDIKTEPNAFPFRQGENTLPIQFGNIVANVVDLFNHIDSELPNWNLDSDRGIGYRSWKFNRFYDPDNVMIEPDE